MKLNVNYLGLSLKNPFMPGASPLTDNLDDVKKIEDTGVAAIVLRSLFEEQILMEENAFHHHAINHAASNPEAASGFYPSLSDFAFDTDHYLEHLRKVKSSVGIPVIASLNGVTHGGWEHHSVLMQEAGADALELNFYDLPTDPKFSAADMENRYLEILKSIRTMVRIPISVKLSPFFSSLPHFANALTAAGADGIVLFNRLYQPDINIEELKTTSHLQLSNSTELPLRLRWLAILEPHFKGTMAVSGGVHTSEDAIKSIMTGASAVQVVSAALRNGPTIFKKLIQETSAWLTAHEYESLEQMRGSMSLRTSPDPTAFSRTNYMKILSGYKVSEFGV